MSVRVQSGYLMRVHVEYIEDNHKVDRSCATIGPSQPPSHSTDERDGSCERRTVGMEKLRWTQPKGLKSRKARRHEHDVLEKEAEAETSGGA